jgi:outer membrane immunogenic protein
MRKLLWSVALVGMLAAPTAVQAQLEAGPILAYYDDLEAIGVGAFIAIPVPQLAEGFAIVPDFTWYFPDGFDYFEVNGDIAYFFPVAADSPVAPFAFGGLSIGRTSIDFGGTIGSQSDTDVGLNLGGGVQFAAGSINPFAGAKFELRDNTGFVIFGGLGFPIGSN